MILLSLERKSKMQCGLKTSEPAWHSTVVAVSVSEGFYDVGAVGQGSPGGLIFSLDWLKMEGFGLPVCELRNKHSNKGKHAMTFSKYLPRGVDNSVSRARSDSEFSSVPSTLSLHHYFCLQKQETSTSWSCQRKEHLWDKLGIL